MKKNSEDSFWKRFLRGLATILFVIAASILFLEIMGRNGDNTDTGPPEQEAADGAVPADIGEE